VQIERLLETLGLPHVRVDGRTVFERIDPPLQALRILIDEKVQAQFGNDLVAEFVHLPKLPGGIDME
jgi:hypothetical protein